MTTVPDFTDRETVLGLYMKHGDCSRETAEKMWEDRANNLALLRCAVFADMTTFWPETRTLQ